MADQRDHGDETPEARADFAQWRAEIAMGEQARREAREAPDRMPTSIGGQLEPGADLDPAYIIDLATGVVTPVAENKLRERIAKLEADCARYRENLRHSQGRFLNINIILSSGGTKREAIALAYLGEDCIKFYLAYGEQHD